GRGDTASGAYATVPGGRGNFASGRYSLAAGRRAKAIHTGAFVWADSQNVDFASTAANQFSIRAQNGLRLADSAGSVKAVAIGEFYRDNAIAAWGRITSAGAITKDYGVVSVSHPSTGEYNITLNASAATLTGLAPSANAVGGVARIVTVDQVGLSVITVYIFDAAGSPVDNEFVFMVTGR
ncbi:MAG: hypothetical protein L0Z48_00710, partial [candidate division Zixibacteria bacterium]|nr:hypothetical protein [candidate division Zixibacteria bacterium]